MRPLLLFAVLLLLAASGWFLWGTNIPLGIAGEWTWLRIEPAPDAAWNLVAMSLAGALGASLVQLVRRRWQTRSPGPLEQTALLLCLVVAGGAWLWLVQETAPPAGRLSKGPFVLYYPQMTGYFFKARYESPDPLVLLRDYNRLMTEGDVLHVGTHPPGLFLVFQGLIAAVGSSPALASLGMQQPASVREACDVIAMNVSASGREFLPTDRAVLWLATLLSLGLTASGALPLYLWVRRWCDPATAWTAGALWPCVPSVAIFLPKSDVLFATVGLWPLLVATLLAQRCATDRGRSVTSLILAMTLGLLLWVGLMLSLVFLPVALACVGTIVLGAFLSPAGDPAGEAPTLNRALVRSLTPLLVVAGTFLLLTLAFWIVTNCRMWDVWAWNYRNHAAFYAQSPRSYGPWLVANTLETAIALGAPLALLALMGAGRLIRLLSRVATSRHPALAPLLSILAVWGLLWLSGKNAGETARLWVPFFPWAIALATTPGRWLMGQAASVGAMTESEPVLNSAPAALPSALPAPTHPTTSATGCVLPPWLVPLQMAACIVTVHRIGGFHFVWPG